MEYNTDHSGYPEYEQPLLPEDNQMLTEEKRRFAECLDEDIVEMSHNGDAAAEEYLLDKYKNFVRSKARSYFLVGADHEGSSSGILLCHDRDMTEVGHFQDDSIE